MAERRQRLVQRRKAAGLSQEALASLLTVERSTVVRWESGETDPQPWVRPNLAQALRVSLETLEDLLAAGPAAKPGPGRDSLPGPGSLAASAGAQASHPWSAGVAVPVRQLPPTVADFTGRTAQLDRLADMLSPRDDIAGIPIAVVSGLPGSGKTALALQVAHRMRSRFPDGQLWVALQGAASRPRDPGEVLGELLRALGVAGPAVPPTTAERAALYRSLLAGRRMLVLADDAASSAQVEPLLPGTGQCAMLVTSRSEQAGPPGARLLPLDPLTQSEAVELLTRIVGDQRVTAEPGAAAQLAAVCGQLPLAVRIAGARLAARTSWQLSAFARKITLARRLDELEAGDLSVRGSLTQSYQALDESARRAFRLLPLLGSGDITEWQVAALLGIPDAAAIVDRLATSSLLTAAGIDRAGQPRFRCHDLLRDYAAELLASEPSQERDTTAARLASGWLQLAALANAALPREPYFSAPPPPDSLSVIPEPVATAITADPIAWFTTERLSLHDTIERCCAAGDYDTGAHLATLMASFHHLQSRPDDAERAWQTVATAAGQAGDQAAAARAQLRSAAGLCNQGRHAEARAAVDQCVNVFARVDDDVALAAGLYWQASCELNLGAYSDCLQSAERSRRLAQDAGNPRAESLALRMLALAQANLPGHRGNAVRSAERALALARELGEPVLEEEVLHTTAHACNLTGRHEDGLRLSREGFDLAQRLGMPAEMAAWLGISGDACQGLARYSEAAESLRSALPIFRDHFMRRHYALCLLKLGDTYQATGDYRAALRHLSESLSIFSQLHLEHYVERVRQTIKACQDGRSRIPVSRE